MGRRSDRAYDLEVVTSGGTRIGLMLVPDQDGVKRVPGALAPADAAEQFRRQDIARSWSDCSAGAGYSYHDERAPNGYDYALGVDTRVPGSPIPGGKRTSVDLTGLGVALGPIRAHWRVNTDLYFLAGPVVLKVAAGTGAPTVAADLSVGMGYADWVGQSATEHNGAWIVGGYRTSTGLAGPVVKYDGTTFTYANVSSPGDIATAWMVEGDQYQIDADGVGNYRLFGTTYGDTTFKYLTGSVNPLVGSNWTPASGTGGANGDRIGSASFPVRSWASTNQRVWAIKADGVFESTRAGTYLVNIAPYYVHHPSADTASDHLARGSIYMNGSLYASGIKGIDRISGLDGRRNDVPGLIGFGQELPYSGPVGGRAEVLFDDGSGWLGAIYYNKTNRTSYVCYGRPRDEIPGQPGLTSYVWHGATVVLPADRQATDAFADAPFGVPRLWIASVGTGVSNLGTVYLDYVSLPRDGNPLNDLMHGGPHQFETDAYLYLPRDPWGRYSARKTPRRWSCVSEDVDQVSYLELALAADGGTFTDVGVPITQTPYQTGRIATPDAARFIQPRVRYVGTETAPPRFKELTVRAGWSVEPYAVLQIRVLFGEGLRLNDGGWSTDDPRVTWNQILGTAGDAPVTLYTWAEEEITAQIEQSASWIEAERLTPEGWQREAVLTFTTLNRTIRYGEGWLYGSGIEWGG